MGSSLRGHCLSYQPLIRLSVTSLIILVLAAGCRAVETISLNADWTLSTEYQNIRISNQNLPIGIYSALENNGYVGPIYDSFNDVNLRWIARRNWTFETRFPTPKFTDTAQVKLTFLGIDTIATIRLNDKLLGNTNNMFVRYTFDVKDLLQSNSDASADLNSLSVLIENPMEVASNLARSNNFTPPNCPPGIYNGECHMNFLRKMQASFAWDWGLAAPSSGLWKGVQLEVYDVAIIRDTTVFMELKDNAWKLRFQVYLETGVASSRVKGQLEILLPGINNSRVTVQIDKQSDENGELIADLDVTVPEEQVKLWWPNGFGEQVLYTVHVSFEQHDNQVQADRLKDTKTLRIGFRTIKLIQEPLGNGLSFHFEVNGHAMFMKGSNWIPSDALPERSADRRRIRHLLTAAKEAHMNMLRVWGGGVYESDYFYDLADEYGILIWQDLMFACAMYPVFNDFLASVRIEVAQNTRRLQHHPCIAIFATNNENEAALVQNWYGTKSEAARFRQEYRALYIDVVKKTVEENDKWRVCLSSSPSNGLKAINDSYISANPQDNNYGDIHYYNFVADGWNWSVYPRPRFVSEYGFQSYPALSSWGQATGGNDYLPDLMKHRQHSPTGELPMLLLINRHLPLSSVPEKELVQAKIYFSQIAQAQAIKTETELYRTLRGSLANTMGALYWQLNDVWVAPSWSSIDFLGKFKILHYFARKFLQPTSVIPILSPANVVEIYVVNDALEVGDGAEYTVVMRMCNWADLEMKPVMSWPVKMEANSAFQLNETVPLWKLFNASTPAEEHFLQFTLTDDKERVVSSNYLYPTPIKKAKGVRNVPPVVTIDSNVCDNVEQTVTLSVRTKAPLLFFYIDILNEGVENYQLNDNGLMIVDPITTLTITYPNPGCAGTQLQLEHLRILTVNQYMAN